MSGDAIFTPDVKWTPWWWEGRDLPPTPPRTPPTRADAVVVGAGYTGLSAARTLAEGGRSVLVLEAGRPGDGASSRAGGMIGDRLRWSFGELVARHGTAKAVDISREMRASVDHVEAVVRDHSIDCHFGRTGRYYAAYRAATYEAQARDLELLARHLPTNAEMVPKAEQSRILGTETYVGGRLDPDGAAVHSAFYHQGLLGAALAAGVTVLGETPLTGHDVGPDRTVTVTTPRGRIQARDLVMATNGYSGPAARDLRRRVIPIASTIIATEELPAATIARLFPGGRMISDSRKLLHYYRPSPDGRRVLFGGRPKLLAESLGTCARRLRADMVEIFPELGSVRISHAWTGNVAYTFDKMPHVGQLAGVWYAMGYCGSGVAMATWLGHKVALKVQGNPAGRTAFDDLPFQTRLYYRGRPWFLPIVSAWYWAQDRFG